MRLWSCGASAAVLLSAVTSNAADLPSRLPPPLPPPPAIFTWSGFYIGPNIGGAFGSDDRVGIHKRGGRNIRGNRFLGNPVTLRETGVFGGAQLGYNYQFGSFVVGVEVDGEGSSVEGAKSARGGSRLNFSQVTAASKVDAFGTARGRVGYAFNRFLVYGTGGVAVAHVNYNVLITGSNNQRALNTQIQDDNAKFGYVFGGGVEYAITNNWSVKAEYQFIGLGRDELTAPFRRRAGQASGFTAVTEETPQFQTVRIGANYRF